MSASASPQKSKKRGREWAPRIWEGCNFPAWIRLLVRNRFAVHPPYWYIAIIITFVSLTHTLIRFFEQAFLRHKVRKTAIRQAPLFILGHWRSGTTLLHELLILDERHSFPTTYQCLEPNHFLLTEEIFSRLFWFLLPGRRPMDNMAAGWGRPQEDEFALCMLGEPSPYLAIAFPNHAAAFPEYLDLETVPHAARERWKRTFFGFLQRITYKNPKRLVLKSPPHTARIPILLELFPDAKFVHIVRDPFVVFPSTINLWKSMTKKHGLQTPTHAELDEQVFSMFTRMYEKFEASKSRIQPGHLHELKYEDLVRDPVGEMRQLYERLDLGAFDAALPQIAEYLDRTKGYETNKYDLTPEQRSLIELHWGDWMRRYGYS